MENSYFCKKWSELAKKRLNAEKEKLEKEKLEKEKLEKSQMKISNLLVQANGKIAKFILHNQGVDNLDELNKVLKILNEAAEISLDVYFYHFAVNNDLKRI